MPRISANPKFALLALTLLLPFTCLHAQGRGGGRGPGGGGGAPGGMPGGGFPGGGGGGFPGSGGGFPGSNGGTFPGGGHHGDMGTESIPVGRPTVNRSPSVSSGSSSTRSMQTSHATLSFGPSGRWWDDKKFSRSVGIDDDQRKRMDSIFSDNKGALAESYNALQREEKTLSKLVESRQPDEARIMAQIDTVFQARANMEKTMTKTMLALRGTLTAKQQEQLEAKTRELQEHETQQQEQ